MALVDQLTEDDLARLNALLPWQCFTHDAADRMFGAPASSAKRSKPQAIPDRRIVLLNERFPLSGKTVLEVGCFEGVHTAGLAQMAHRVKACDSRIENVVKTIVRCAMLGRAADVTLWDVEGPPPPGFDAACNVLHHVGVLYHLVDPVAHLRAIAPFVGEAMMIGTHYATPDTATDSYESGGDTYRCRMVGEGGRDSVFSGMGSFARWLRLDDLCGLLTRLGFASVDIWEDAEERNGPRVLLFARR